MLSKAPGKKQNKKKKKKKKKTKKKKKNKKKKKKTTSRKMLKGESLMSFKIEGKAMIRNRYNYPTPPIRDSKGKETQTLMETSLAESQTISCFPIKWPNGYPKQKYISDTSIQRRTITKINHDRRTALERSVKSISLGGLNRFYVATILALTSVAV